MTLKLTYNKADLVTIFTENPGTFPGSTSSHSRVSSNSKRCNCKSVMFFETARFASTSEIKESVTIKVFKNDKVKGLITAFSIYDDTGSGIVSAVGTAKYVVSGACGMFRNRSKIKIKFKEDGTRKVYVK
jgi:hypothetical protein